MRIVVLGGIGLVGSKVVDAVIARGHRAVAAAPSTGADALTGVGLAEVLAGASVVVDASNSSTPQLLAAEFDARVGHHVVLSVVGADRMAPHSGSLRATVAQEALVATGPIPYTVVRATQFFEHLGADADAATMDGTVRLPPVLIRPMAAADVARALVAAAVGEPRRGVVEVGGPREYVLPELIRTALVARGDTRSVIADPAAPYLGGHLGERTLLPGAHSVIQDVLFEDWIIETAARG